MGTSLNLSASLVDAIAAAAGSFLIGLIALRALELPELALYALMYSGGFAAMVIPQQMGYLPRRIAVNTAAEVVRGRYATDLLGATPYVALAMLAVVAAGSPLYTSTGGNTALILASTAALWVAASSFQDHIRTSLHITANHAGAAATSLVQLGVAASVFGLVLLFQDDIPYAVLCAVPFGALTLSNSVSACIGIFIHRTTPPIGRGPRPSFSVSFRTALSGFILHASSYVTNLSVALSLGAAALASLESTRVAAQPVLVAGTALSSFFLPKAIRFQSAGADGLAYRRVRRMVASQAVLGAGYSAIAPVFALLLSSWTGNPIDPFLAVALAIAFALQSMVGPINQMNIAARKYALATISTIVAAAVTLATVLLLLSTAGLFAVPLALTAGALTRGAMLLLARRFLPG
ncbi:hypothetical protein [Microbacterium sp. zg.Y909]|uniref:hypothetical protein n=1 Tax=Microbacterium sp. zg.Y909 TaxID=2969413 RepID=UPI00214BE32D|nr:hypothetical protein [Microbacterium sp. zg.Y909]MCR2824240.1 hypothetical protein [Microbacterium sp. zg.Y909]